MSVIFKISLSPQSQISVKLKFFLTSVHADNDPISF